MTTFSFLVFGLILWMRARFNSQADFTTIIIPTVLQGIAMAMFFIPLVTVTLSGLPPSRIPAASGLSNFMRIMAGGIGASVSTTLWENRAILHHARLSENINLANTTATNAIGGLQAQGMSAEQAYAQITRLIDQQAYMLAANDIFYISAIGFVALIAVVWVTRPIKPGAGGKGNGGSAEASGAH